MQVPEQPDVDEENKDLLWSILTASGLYKNYTFAGTVTNFKAPTNPTSNLVGIPFTGTNTGINPALRLMQFSIGNRTGGPISLLGSTRLKTINNLLVYSFSWTVESFDDDPVNVGFYTSNYLSGDQGQQRALIIGSQGPSLFTAVSCNDCKRCNNSESCNGFKGQFFCTDVDDIFVVVDKNVAMTLIITAASPDSIVYPKLELFKPLAYRLSGEEHCGCNGKQTAFAIEELVDNVQQIVYLKPAKEYIDLTARMVAYLNATLVTIILTPESSTGTGSLPATQLYPVLNTQFSENSISNNMVVPFTDIAPGTSWQVETDVNLARGINTTVAESNPDAFTDPFEPRVSFTLDITAPGLLPGGTAIQYQPTVELGISHNNFIPYPVRVGDNMNLNPLLSGESATYTGLVNTLSQGVCAFGIRVTFTSGVKVTISAANPPSVTIRDLAVTYQKIVS